MHARVALKQLFPAVVPTAFALAVLLAAQAARAQQVAGDAKSAAAANSAAMAASSAKHIEGKVQAAEAVRPESEGIEIHGHWVIDVRNPDGKLVEHRDFENSLVTVGLLISGDQLLAGLLSGNVTAGDPGIGLVQGALGSDANTYCNNNNDFTGVPGGIPPPNSTCFGLSTANSGMTNYLANFIPTLTSTVSFSPAVNWVLSGTYTVPATLTSISAVQTLVSTCFSATAPYASLVQNPISGKPGGVVLAGSTTGRGADFYAFGCFETAPASSPSIVYYKHAGGIFTDYLVFATFTSADLPTPLAVSEGQIITVTTTISFS